MAVRFLRIILVCAVTFIEHPAKSEAQVVNITQGVSGVLDIPHTLHVKDPESVFVPRGQPVTLRCNVRTTSSNTISKNAPIITWLHDSKAIPKNDTRRIVQKDGNLYIPRVVGGKKPLTGLYRCKVKNELGVLLSGEAKVTIASFELNTTEEIIEVPEHQPVILPCEAQSFPESKIRWDFNKQNLPHNSRYVPLPSGALLIFKSLSIDTGVYRCIVSNNILKKTKIKNVKLTVLPTLNEEKPVSILKTPVNLTVTLGVRTSLYCLATGWPFPNIEWIKDGIIVSNTSILNISTVDRSSNGTYVCKAKNSLNEAQQLYQLNVQQKPYFTILPKSKSYISAGTVKLECQANGFPEPCVYWMKNGKKLKLGGRIKKKDGVLVMSHTFTYDAGIYQCVASNSAGTIWTSAQVVLTSPPPPPPPSDVKCRAYDERSVCITWKTPSNVQPSAFSIYSFYKTHCSYVECKNSNDNEGCDNNGFKEESGPDYVTLSGNNYLATGLNYSTNYTFYVRLYSKVASDDSNRAFCSTGVHGERNLKFRLLTSDSIELIWSEISSDIPCDMSVLNYTIQWKNENFQLINTSYTNKLKFNVTGLQPSVLYHFRVTSSYKNDESKWTSLMLSDIDKNDENNNNTNLILKDSHDLQNFSDNLEGFGALQIGTTFVTLNWVIPDGHPKSYVICYVKVDRDKKQKCEDGKLVMGTSNIKQIDGLEPNTQYEFRIRVVNSEGFYGAFSSPLVIRTHPDVPSTVLDLKFKIINETSACLAWSPPIYTNGKLNSYILSYTPDPSWPLEDWTVIIVPSNQNHETNLSCWFDRKGKTVSVLMTRLKSTEKYTVIVRAVSNVGLGDPSYPFSLRTVSKNRVTYQVTSDNGRKNFTDNQKMGVIVGCLLALACIACCVTCIVLRRRCIKRRNLAQARLVASNNYYPAIHYASQNSSVQVRLENVCSSDLHEIETLVNDENHDEPIPSQHSQMDTKGRNILTNGNINGVKKLPLTNGNIYSGHVHITENPQFEKKNGEYRNNFKLFQDDPNSNRIQSYNKFNFLEISPKKKRHKRTNTNNVTRNFFDDDSFNFSSKDYNSDAETTQLTCLDDSFALNNHRRISPLLEPNG